MKKSREKSYTDKVISKLVENTFEPIHMLISKNNTLREVLDLHLQSGLAKIDRNEQPQNFDIERNGVMDVRYRYVLSFEYAGKRPEPELTGIMMEIDGSQFTHKVNSISELPKFEFMKSKTLMLDRKQIQKPRTIAEDKSKGLHL